jgi:hypothetical protein
MVDDEQMDISLWFNLTYASYLVLPRLWLENMPLEWQYKFVELLNEIPETLEIDNEYSAQYIVTCKRNGKFVKDIYRDYRHGTIKYKQLSAIDETE